MTDEVFVEIDVLVVEIVVAAGLLVLCAGCILLDVVVEVVAPQVLRVQIPTSVLTRLRVGLEVDLVRMTGLLRPHLVGVLRAVLQQGRRSEGVVAFGLFQVGGDGLIPHLVLVLILLLEAVVAG